MLELFDEFDIAATWATVGFLFAESREELLLHSPARKPSYEKRELDPYLQPIGECEEDDPLHFAPSLIRAIRSHNRQEIGTHTFSHYYCLELHQTRDDFAADLGSAVRLARKRGISIRSLVFPRNQVDPTYLSLLPEFGIDTYRGAQSGWMNNPDPNKQGVTIRRALRLASQYVPVSQRPVTSEDMISSTEGLCNVAGSMFLRPFHPRLAAFDPLRLQRIRASLYRTAKEGGTFHLWWHPHNFGKYLPENLLFLRRVFEIVSDCRKRFAMRSLSMAGLTDARRTLLTDGIAV
jgi:hypothetical protein